MYGITKPYATNVRYFQNGLDVTFEVMNNLPLSCSQYFHEVEAIELINPPKFEQERGLMKCLTTNNSATLLIAHSIVLA